MPHVETGIDRTPFTTGVPTPEEARNLDSSRETAPEFQDRPGSRRDFRKVAPGGLTQREIEKELRRTKFTRRPPSEKDPGESFEDRERQRQFRRRNEEERRREAAKRSEGTSSAPTIEITTTEPTGTPNRRMKRGPVNTIMAGLSPAVLLAAVSAAALLLIRNL